MWLVMLLGAGTAAAQTWSTEATGVLVPQVGTITENGVGSPTVMWDPTIQRYVMFFETMTAPPAGDCINGEWSIGVAASDDGITWDVWPTPVIEPTPGTPWRCVAAHPSVTMDGTDVHLYFKSEQGFNACSGGTQPWGCKNYTGVSHAVMSLALDDFTNEIATVEAQITSIESSRDAEMDLFVSDLTNFRTLLEAEQATFACASGVPICVPCGGKALDTDNTSANYPSSHSFCQDFEFAIPDTISASLGTPGTSYFTLNVATSTAVTFTCTYRLRNGVWVLDYGPNASVDHRCSNASYTAGTLVTVAGGLTDGTPALQFGKVGQGYGLIALAATNVGDQTYTGGAFDTMDAMLPLAQAYDYDGTQALIGDLITDLTSLGQWLATHPPIPVDLYNSGLDLYNFLYQFDEDLTIWKDQLTVLYDQLSVYQSYTQSVATTLDSGTALGLKRSLGFPSVMKVGTDWLMTVQDGLDIKRATSTAAAGPFTLDATPIVSAGQVSWGMTEVFEPNLVCDGGVMPYQMYFGGRTETAGVITDGGISDAVSDDLVTWLANLGTQLIGWTNPDAYRHFDVIRSSDGEARMWWTEKVGGLNQVGVSSTTATFDDTLSQQRVCP
ncbi:MAG: hypothetical protein H6735_23305 [Alphaproteobacteria bacterium]|nr:hypothetical protein [Alphaproteobacteria bacterium]